MRQALPCLRRTEPTAALCPRRGQSRLSYVPAATTDIRRLLDEVRRQQGASRAACAFKKGPP
jgi:hypothetical protein